MASHAASQVSAAGAGSPSVVPEAAAGAALVPAPVVVPGSVAHDANANATAAMAAAIEPGFAL